MRFRNSLYKVLSFFAPVYGHFTRNRLRVLAYHSIPDENIFEEQIGFLAEKYNIITVDNLASYFQGDTSLKERPLLITFDDGDISVFNKGLPILKKYNVSASLFIITSLIGTQDDFWWDTIRKNEKSMGRSASEIAKKIKQHKKLRNKERLESLSLYQPTCKLQLNIQQLKELDRNHIQICNHSHTHPMFDKCEEVEIIREIEEVKEKFEDWKMGDFQYFAYPNGNYDKKSENLLRIHGISLAFLFDHKLNLGRINPLRISRLAIDADNPMPEFKTKVSGFHSCLFHLRNHKLSR